MLLLPERLNADPWKGPKREETTTTATTNTTTTTTTTPGWDSRHYKHHKWSIPWIKSPTPWTPETSGVQAVTTCVKLITHLQGEVHFRMHLKLALRYFLMTILRHFAETHTEESVIFIISADQHLVRLNAILVCVYMILLLWLSGMENCWLVTLCTV